MSLHSAGFQSISVPGRLRGKGKCQGISFFASMFMENLFNKQHSPSLLSAHAPSPAKDLSPSGLA